MPKLQPGEDGEPLPDDIEVLRLAIPNKNFSLDDIAAGRVSLTHALVWPPFKLSPEDEKQVPPRLSVWAEPLTSPQQAWELMGRKAKYQIVLYLSVETIRSLKPKGVEQAGMSLDVVWEPLQKDSNGRRIPDTTPGADGHSGITNLDASNDATKLRLKSLRSQLAEQARVEVLTPPSVGDNEGSA